MVRSQQERKSKRAALDHDGGTEMTGVIEHRDPALVREELADLARYLNGVPEEIRSTGAFGAYDQRAGELSRELILAELRTLPIPDDRKVHPGGGRRPTLGRRAAGGRSRSIADERKGCGESERQERGLHFSSPSA